ncbi:hypothetical protein KM043_018532 [Ampulex compressa]|nr:hypothetical protein KM043_018532 [Ampulex compressa]
MGLRVGGINGSPVGRGAPRSRMSERATTRKAEPAQPTEKPLTARSSGTQISRSQGQRVSRRSCFVVSAGESRRETLSARYTQPSSHASASPGRTAFGELTSTSKEALLGGEMIGRK